MSNENKNDQQVEMVNLGQIEISTEGFDAAPDLESLPILPTRNLVMFPGVTVPLSIGRDGSLTLARAAAEGHFPIGIICQEDPEEESPTLRRMLNYGVFADVFRVLEMPDGTHTALIRARGRFRVMAKGSGQCATGLTARVREVNDLTPADPEEMLHTLAICSEIACDIMDAGSPGMSKQLAQMLDQQPDEVMKMNMMATNLPLPLDAKRKMISTGRLLARARTLAGALIQEKKNLDIRREIMEKAGEKIKDNQRSAFLQQQLDTIKEELYGTSDVPDGDDDYSELLARAEKVKFPREARQTFEKEVAKLRRLNPSTPDYSVQYAYLETLLELPWGVYSNASADLAHAREILDHDHYGLKKVKERILEQLAVLMNGGGAKSPILCLVGPPGVGKTSLGRSIAAALGRKYERVSLGGVHDEAEIRGHRRTYVGAMPGRVIKAVRHAKSANPVLVLDEIDKLGTDHRGDPSDALLEVLDPEQNRAFHDNYIDLDFDLSKVLFIATANELGTIPAALLDRMEVIDISGYLLEEKLEIARRHIIPRVLADNNIADDGSVFAVSDEGLTALIEQFTCESGVRQLEKRLASLARKCLLRSMEGRPAPLPLGPDALEGLLDTPPALRERPDDTGLPGVVTGLAWTAAGGEIMLAEASVSPGKGEKLTLTGNLGDVMKESATIAFQWVRSHASELGIDSTAFDDRHLHIHFPEGAIPKDGPSAGITIASAIASAFSGRPARNDMAMTGEITLRGRVLPVGGVKEKILAAKRAGISHIILSDDNRRDIVRIPDRYLQGMEFHYVRTADEVLRLILK